VPQQRTTLYGVAPAEQVRHSYLAPPLAALPVIAMPLRRRISAAA
jgi:hypothetical protein